MLTPCVIVTQQTDTDAALRIYSGMNKSRTRMCPASAVSD